MIHNAPPNYQRATYTAHDLLQKNNVATLPIDIFAIVRSQKNIKLLSYEDFATMNDISYEEVSQYFNGEFGACSKELGKERYIIVYDNRQNIGVIRFTIAHEYGHIVLEHFAVLGNNDSAEMREAIEKEANCFARNFLAPSCFFNDNNNEIEIAACADITLAAAKVRVSSLPKDKFNLEQSISDNA